MAALVRLAGSPFASARWVRQSARLLATSVRAPRAPPSATAVASSPSVAASPTPVLAPSEAPARRRAGANVITTMTFAQLGVPSNLDGKLVRAKLRHPTPVQAEVLPKLLRDRGSDVVITAETGSGKTFAYLIPILARLEELRLSSRVCRAIIVVPTRELAKQVYDVVQMLVAPPKKKDMTGVAQVVVRRLVGEVTQLRLNTLKSDPPHVVIGTPNTLAALVPSHLSIGDLQFLVCDEIDHLTQFHSRASLAHLLAAANRVSKRPQIVFVSATTSLDVRQARQKYLRRGGKGETLDLDLTEGQLVIPRALRQHIAVSLDPADAALPDGSEGRARWFEGVERAAGASEPVTPEEEGDGVAGEGADDGLSDREAAGDREVGDREAGDREAGDREADADTDADASTSTSVARRGVRGDEGPAASGGGRRSTAVSEDAILRRKMKAVTQLLASLEPRVASMLVFCKDASTAEALTAFLRERRVPVAGLFASKRNRERSRALARVKEGHARVLVSSDMASRGLDIPRLSHVLNFDPPQTAQQYVHRAGRVGRLRGDKVVESAVLTLTTSPTEQAQLHRILRSLRFSDSAARRPKLPRPEDVVESTTVAKTPTKPEDDTPEDDDRPVSPALLRGVFATDAARGLRLDLEVVPDPAPKPPKPASLTSSPSPVASGRRVPDERS